MSRSFHQSVGLHPKFQEKKRKIMIILPSVPSDTINQKKTETKPLRVMSLFDGISCGQIALKRAGIPVESYYASEIKISAIRVTKKHFPDTIQLGDIRKIDFTQFKGKVDLLINIFNL